MGNVYLIITSLHGSWKAKRVLWRIRNKFEPADKVTGTFPFNIFLMIWHIKKFSRTFCASHFTLWIKLLKCLTFSSSKLNFQNYAERSLLGIRWCYWKSFDVVITVMLHLAVKTFRTAPMHKWHESHKYEFQISLVSYRTSTKGWCCCVWEWVCVCAAFSKSR